MVGSPAVAAEVGTWPEGRMQEEEEVVVVDVVQL